MALTAGALSQVSVGSNNAVLSSAAATMGTAPYAYQWYQSNTSGFSVGPTNIITGATSLSLSVSNLVPNSIYYYKVVVTDSESPAVTATSAQLVVTTLPTTLSQNVFAMSPIVGMVDMPYNTNTFSAQVDVSASTNLLYPGMAVKIVANTQGGVPRVIACSSSTDNVFGFVNYNIKNISVGIGQNLEVSMDGNVMWLYATGAISQGAQVCLNTAVSAGVQATGASATVVGFALDGAAAAGALIRVKLKCPSFATA